MKPTPKSPTPANDPKVTPKATPLAPGQDLPGARIPLLKRLSAMPGIFGHYEYDARIIRDNQELRLLNRYELCREAIRQAQRRLPFAQRRKLADILWTEPHLVALPINHKDMEYFSAMSDMLTIWQSCSPECPGPPPFLDIIDQIREFTAKARKTRMVGVELMQGSTYLKSKASQSISRTILVHVPIVGAKPSLPLAMKQLQEAFVASGLFDDNGGGRESTDFLAIAFYRACQGNQEAKARLSFIEKLNKDDEGQTEFGKKLYAAAIDNKLRSPSESSWSEGVHRIDKKVMRLAELIMKMIGDGSLRSTPKKSRVRAADLKQDNPPPGLSEGRKMDAGGLS